MKRSTLFMLLAPAVLVFAVSCKQKDKVNAMIPADAGVVLHINTPSLSSKLSWQEIQQTTWFKEMYAEAADSLAKKLLDNPENSGIDSKADLVFFAKKQGRGGYFAFEGTVKDASAFEAFNKTIAKSSAVKKEGDFSSLNIENKAVVTWNNSRFVYVGDAPMGAANYSFDKEGGSAEFHFPADSLSKFGKDLFSLSGDENLGSNDKYAELVKEAGDVHLWVNSSNLYGNLGAGMLSLMKLNVLFEGNVSASTLNFDNGKITVKSRQYYGKEMTDLIKKYSPKPISDDAVNRIPSNDLVGAVVFNYPPEGLKEFIKLVGVDGMVNGFLGNAGYSVDEFVKANKGEIVLAFSDFKMKSTAYSMPDGNGETYVYNTSTPDIKFLFSAAINDKAAFDKLIGTIQGQIPEREAAEINKQLTYQLNKDWFVASNSPDYVSKFLSGSSAKHPYSAKLTGHPFAGFVDIQKILKVTGESMTDASNKDVMDASIKLWNDINFHGGEVKDGAMLSEIEINLVDKNTNSLKQLNSYIDLIAKKEAAKKKAQYEMPESADSDGTTEAE